MSSLLSSSVILSLPISTCHPCLIYKVNAFSLSPRHLSFWRFSYFLIIYTESSLICIIPAYSADPSSGINYECNSNWYVQKRKCKKF